VLRLIRERFLSKKKYVQHYYQDADVVNENVMRELATLDDTRPTFLFAHYMDPHDPYFSHPYDGYGIARVSNPHPPAEMAEELSRLYDGEVSFLDERLGLLFDRMRELGIYDDWVIVLTSDHGEEFYEHEGWWHGLTLYQEQVRVPLIIKLPRGEFSGLRVPGLVRQIDISPTVLALAGGSHGDFQGVDLMPAVAGLVTPPGGEGEEAAEAAPDGEEVAAEWQLDTVFSEEDHEGNQIHALIAGKWKLIRANEGNPRGLPTLALYNLEEDPGETVNLAAQNAELVAELDRQLEERLTVALESAVERVEGDGMDEATRSRLEALGYLEE
jgi:arylsulfatase A-like enzyme